MKYITLIIVLLVVGCGNSDKVKLLEEENNRLKGVLLESRFTAEAKVKLLEEKLKEAEEATPTASPVKELTAEEKKVVGEYETELKDTIRFVILENRKVEVFLGKLRLKIAQSGKKVENGKWKISEEGEIHVKYDNGAIDVLRINPDASITWIAVIDKDGERIDTPKENQATYTKIK